MAVMTLHEMADRETQLRIDLVNAEDHADRVLAAQIRREIHDLHRQMDGLIVVPYQRPPT